MPTAGVFQYGPLAVTSPKAGSRRSVLQLALAIGLAMLVLPAGLAPSASATTTSDYSWVLTGGQVQPGVDAIAELVQTPDGMRVLAAGGSIEGRTAASRLYDPASGLWADGTPMHRARSGARSVLLDDGRVLVVGGDTTPADGGARGGTFELYDPPTATWSEPQSMPVRHDYATLTRLPDGRVLIAGGGDGYQGDGDKNAESLLFDPATDSITATGSLRHARYQHGATLLHDGRVLVVGGDGTGTAEIYDPAIGTWADAAPTSGLRWTVGGRSPLPVLADGRVLAVGFDSTRSAEIYDPASNAWTAPMALEDQPMVVADLRNGLVVLTGYPGSSSFFDAATSQWSAGPRLPVTYQGGVGVLLPGGTCWRLVETMALGEASACCSRLIRAHATGRPP